MVKAIVAALCMLMVGCGTDEQNPTCEEPIGVCELIQACVQESGPELYKRSRRVVEGTTEGACHAIVENDYCMSQPCCHTEFDRFTPVACPGTWRPYTPDTQVTVGAGAGVGAAATGYGGDI